MEIIEQVDIGASPRELYQLVSDLSSYPDWLGLVERADRQPGDAPTWTVELRGRIGPLARSKRLQMIRSETRQDAFVRFERAESDGRDHAVWQLEATIEEVNHGSRLTMRLYYGGNRFAVVLAPVLRDEVQQARQTLQARYPTQA